MDTVTRTTLRANIGPDELGSWAKTPYGRYIVAWEQERLAHTVRDIFGYHALQVGAPDINYLSASRISHRWVYVEKMPMPVNDSSLEINSCPKLDVIVGHYSDLPFRSDSIDLVILPHTLELCSEPHRLLREVDRVLAPHGRIILVGFNTLSLWSLCARWQAKLQSWRRRSIVELCVPQQTALLSMLRLKDWLQLLGYNPRSSSMGGYRWPRASGLTQALEGYGVENVHKSSIECAGLRWWPMFGAAYLLEAIKEVKSRRLVGLIRSRQKMNFSRAVSVNKKDVVSTETSSRSSFASFASFASSSSRAEQDEF